MIDRLATSPWAVVALLAGAIALLWIIDHWDRKGDL